MIRAGAGAMWVRKGPRPVWCRPGVGGMNRAPPAEACVVSAGGVFHCGVICIEESSGELS